jgi:hypothetical protein
MKKNAKIPLPTAFTKARKKTCTPQTVVNGKKFTCTCGCPILEEVLGHVTQYSDITDVYPGKLGAGAEYGLHSCDGGDIVCIQCRQCGEQLAEDFDSLVELAKNDPRFK